MQTLELECPTCQEVLELDAGFAGGVCRCSKCGTLMTVPSGKGSAETLSRPSTEPDYEDDLAGLSDAGSSRPGGVEAGEYRTASGKVVKLDGSVRVPTASVRKKVRIATTIVFFGVVLAGVVAGVLVILLIINSGKGPGGGGSGEQVVQYDPAANPYELTFLNLAGIPLEGSVAVVVEASIDSEDWAIDFSDMVVNGLSQELGEASISFIAASEQSYAPIDKTAAAELSAGDIADWFSNLPAEGTPDFAAAVADAVDGAPDTIILVLSDVDGTSLDRWNTLLNQQQRLTVHAILIDGGGSESSMRDWITSRSGEGKLVTFESSNFEYLKELAEEQ